MRIAVVSDIHGNLMALDAVMTDIESQAPDEVWCAGDLGWGGPWASECIQRVREAGWTTIRGNTDIWITGDPQTIEAPEEREELKRVAIAHAITKEDADWLVSLPLGHQGPASVLMVHGTPDSPFVAPGWDAPDADFVPYESKAKLVIYGHVHQIFVRMLQDGTVVANPGSVGMPKDGPTASYLILDHRGSSWTIKPRRVNFDRRAGIAQAKQVGGPVGERFLEWFGTE